MTNDMAIHPHPTIYHVDLCSGSGMLGLAVKLALGGQLRTVAYVEREAYAAAALVARMADAALDQAPVWDDVTAICEPGFREIVEGLRPLVLTAGYPCQPFSLAGKRLGANDPRHLWPFIDGFIGQVKPECVFLENVPGHLGLGFGRVRRDLEGRGYRVAAGLFSALEVGASHKRERLFILALADTNGDRGIECARTKFQTGGSGLVGSPLADAQNSDGRTQQQPCPAGCGWAGSGREQPHVANPIERGHDGRTHLPGWQEERGIAAAGPGAAMANAPPMLGRAFQRSQPDGVLSPVADAGQPGPQGTERSGALGERLGTEAPGSAAEFCLPLFAPGPFDLEAWRGCLALDPALEPAFCRVADGLAAGLDANRLRLAGNGVVPLAAAYAFVSLWAALEYGGAGGG